MNNSKKSMLKHPLAFAITAAGLALSLSAGVHAAENGKFRIGVVTFLSGPAAGPFGEPSANAAKVLVEGLRRAGPKPSREKIQTALESIQKFDLGGLDISYGPDDHTGLDFADLSIIGTDGKFRR